MILNLANRSLRFVVEQTGGGCTAHVAQIDGGVIVTNDGNGGTDYGAMIAAGHAIHAGFYPGDSWYSFTDSHDSTHEGTGATPAHAVADLLDNLAKPTGGAL